MRSNLFFTLFFAGLIPLIMKAQEPENHYTIKFFSVTASNISNMKSLLSSITGAHSISVNPKDSVFTLSTTRLLDEKVVSGKLQKSFYPVKSIRHLETPVDPFPTMQHTGDASADALRYEQEKKSWIEQNPGEYKKMLEKN